MIGRTGMGHKWYTTYITDIFFKLTESLFVKYFFQNRTDYQIKL